MNDKTKDGIMITTACVMLASGIALSFLSFFLSASHIVHDSALWYFAQTIVYASSVFGIGSYVHLKLRGVETNPSNQPKDGRKSITFS